MYAHLVYFFKNGDEMRIPTNSSFEVFLHQQTHTFSIAY